MATTSTNGTKRKAADNSSKLQYYRQSTLFKVPAEGQSLKNFAFLCQNARHNTRTVNEELKIVRQNLCPQNGSTKSRLFICLLCFYSGSGFVLQNLSKLKKKVRLSKLCDPENETFQAELNTD